jgi:hypothetical protein
MAQTQNLPLIRWGADGPPDQEELVLFLGRGEEIGRGFGVEEVELELGLVELVADLKIGVVAAAGLKGVHEHAGQCAEGFFLSVGERARFVVDGAECTDGESVGRDQRGAGIEADLFGSGDERVAGEAGISEGVGDDEQAAGFVLDSVRAKRDAARSLAGRGAGVGLEPLAVLIDERDDGDGHAAGAHHKAGVFLELGLRECIEDVVTAEAGHTEVVVTEAGRKREVGDERGGCHH